MHGAETGASPRQNSTARDSADMIMQAQSWEAQQVGSGGRHFSASSSYMASGNLIHFSETVSLLVSWR